MTRPIVSPTFVGRREELEELDAALRDARDNELSTVLLGGEAGVGKSRLVDEFTAGVAPDGVRTLVGQCVGLGSGGLAYAPVAGVLRAMVRELGRETVLELAGAGAAALGGLVPDLGAAAAATGDEEGRGRLFDGVTDVLERASERETLIVVIEDVHWADGSTRDLLRFAVRALADARILLVLSYRSDEVTRTHPLRPFLAELDRLRSVRRVMVPRLTAAEVGEQVRGIWGHAPDGKDLRRIHERSEGIPFFVEELLGAGGAEGALPDPLRDLLLVRTEQLSSTAQETLRILAVGGHRVSHRLLSQVSDLRASELDASVYEVVSAGIVHVDAEDYLFRHALLREAVYDDIVPGEHARLHLRYADALETTPRLEDAGGTAAVAYHLDSAHENERAFLAYLDAGDQLSHAYAFREAQVAYEHALDLWDCAAGAREGVDHVDLLRRAARAALDAGELERGLVLIDAALAGVEQAGDEVRRAGLLVLRARVLADLGRAEDLSVLRDSLESLPDGASGPRAKVLRQLASRTMCEARFEESIAAANEAIASADSSELVVSARLVLATSLIHSGRVSEGLELFDECADLSSASPRARAVYHVNYSDALNLLGRYEDAARVAQEGMEGARAAGFARTLGAMIAGNTAEPLLALGEWDRADQLITRALELDPPTRHFWHLRRMQAWLWLWRGDVERAAESVRDTSGSMTKLRPEPQYELPFARLESEVALALSDVDGAWDVVARCLAEPHRAPGYDLPLLAVGARVLGERARNGDSVELAVADVRDRMARIGHWGPSAAWGAVVEAELADGAGGDPEAWRAVPGQKRLPVHLVPYADYRLALALADRGDRAGAADAVAAASDRARELGAGLLVGPVEDVARRIGLRASRDHPERDSDDLTARESEVLLLVAKGRSNKQIGAELFISDKTASVHVSNILAKLGVSSRGEAAAVAHDRGLLGHEVVPGV